MNCKCGMTIGYYDKYCSRCEKNLSLRDVVIEGLRKDELFGSHNIEEVKEDT